MINKLLLLTGLLAVALSVQAQENSGDVSYSETKSSNTAFHTLTFDVGPAWITSKMYTPSGKYTWRTGLELGAEYSCVFSKGYGFGITYLRNHTNYPDANVDLNYIGPSFVYAGNFSEKWRAMAEIGLGYGNINDGSGWQSGFGTKYTAGVEYMLSDKLGVCAKLRNMAVYFGKQDSDYPGDDDDLNGISRLALQLGLCIHL